MRVVNGFLGELIYIFQWVERGFVGWRKKILGMEERGGVKEIPFVVVFAMLMFVGHAQARAQDLNSDPVKSYFSNFDPDKMYSLYCNLKCSNQCPYKISNPPRFLCMDSCLLSCFSARNKRM